MIIPIFEISPNAQNKNPAVWAIVFKIPKNLAWSYLWPFDTKKDFKNIAIEILYLKAENTIYTTVNPGRNVNFSYAEE